ncbi:HDOD domain-containing protein [Helicobacter pullorum]|uniref:HDOD domain-containing protein n=1 Tax=Helicobacter pullorum TaxID=35818 RepID=UPI0006CD458D|nr:HDOD domain-containing protein [Helicobacter pullorum]KPH52677.1 hypothetical protein HPU229254_02400 [Helicobacter pullorum]
MKELIIANIESLPPLSQTIVELQRVCARDDVSVKEVAEVIQTDPFLTASIIKSANAPLYGYTRTVNSVAQAVAIFGVYTAKGLAIVSVVKAQLVINLTPYGLSVSNFTEAANQKGMFISKWYKGSKLLSILVTCALIMHIGMAILSDCLIKSKKGKKFSERLKTTPCIALEKEMLGVNQFEILEMLCEHWHFEPTIIKVIHSLQEERLPQEIQRYVYPLRVLNALINPFSIAAKEQIKNARNLAINYGLDIQGFDETLLAMGFVKSLRELENYN